MVTEEERQREAGRRRRESRLDHHWTQDQLARKTGFTAWSISRWEQGHEPMPESMAVLCDVLGESAGWLRASDLDPARGGPNGASGRDYQGRDQAAQ